MMSRQQIKTFVFFDLEGTGLSDNPRITEITMVAMNRCSGEEMVYRARKSLWAPGLNEQPPDLPRVINKLSVCVYPMKPVCYEAAEITGLNNDNLYQQKDFDSEVGDLILLFLRRLEPPVCLVAHNGSRFDFPLLAAELQSTGCCPLLLVNNQPVLCMDTWEMFRDLAGDPVTYPNRYLREPSSSPPPTVLSPDHQKNPTTSWTDMADSADRLKSKQDGDIASRNFSQHQTPPNKSDSDLTEDVANCKKQKFVSDDNDTNGDSVRHHSTSHARRQLFPDSSSDDCTSRDGLASSPDVGDASDLSLTDHVGDLKTESCDSDVGDSHRAITESHEEAASKNSSSSNNVSGSGDSTSTFQFAGFTRPGRKIIMTAAKRPSYKLVDLHQRIVGYEPTESHRAEDDCLTLARIFWLTPKAPAWADSHAVEFDRFRPLYVMRRKPLAPGKFPCAC